MFCIERRTGVLSGRFGNRGFLCSDSAQPNRIAGARVTVALTGILGDRLIGNGLLLDVVERQPAPVSTQFTELPMCRAEIRQHRQCTIQQFTGRGRLTCCTFFQGLFDQLRRLGFQFPTLLNGDRVILFAGRKRPNLAGLRHGDPGPDVGRPECQSHGDQDKAEPPQMCVEKKFRYL